MVELPEVLGRFTRSPVIILVTGRTAVARVGGISTIRRHVATATRLGLEPVVLFPDRMKALGAEIAGELDGSVRCVASDAFGDEAGDDEDETLVIAADWFISPPAIVDFDSRTRGLAVARTEYRGRIGSPLARMKIGTLRSLIPKLSEHPVSELINTAVADNPTVAALDVSDCHRLSDNAAIGRCETKLFGLHRLAGEPWHVLAFERALAIPLARRLAATPVSPLHLSVMKILTASLAAWILTYGGYWWGVAGAAVYLLSRLLDSTAGDLARAAVREASRGDRLDVIGDLATQIAVVWALALRPEAASAATWLAAIAIVGLLISGWSAYVNVFARVWRAHAAGERYRRVPDNFASRFLRRNGQAYGLLLAAVLARFDLFLWAAAIGSHLFYLLWLRQGRRAAA